MKKGAKRDARYFTQWAATFYVAAELVRRGYLVALTLGTAPKTDLLATSPSGRPFKVEVKGLRRSNFWLIGDVPAHQDLFYALVFVPEDASQRPRFFILTAHEVREEMKSYQEKVLAKGRKIAELDYGFPFRNALKYENGWGKLPK